MSNVRPHSVTLRTLHHLAAAAACFLVSATAAPNEIEPSAILALRQGGELSCEPTLPHFCENMHVRCAGQTTVATFSFKLRTTSGSNVVTLMVQDEENQRKYEGASSEWAGDGSYLVLSPRAANGYVKLQADGKYVFRHYIQGRGVMSLGQCK